MKYLASVVLASGLAAASLVSVNVAAALPGACDGAACVPYVALGVNRGDSCVQATRYNFGRDSSGRTLACNTRGQWTASAPLVGVRLLRSPCGANTGVAQTPDGVPLRCVAGAWSADYHVVLYDTGDASSSTTTN